ncbi:MAG: hypothetical protein MUE60_15785 [Candidatus Eisenbacteria bacterium]|nr:hypothetical protein [Candidatus Eisenbacteria bacterium]
MHAITVTPYDPRDREEIDRGLFADLFTSYYTDIEPSSIVVARRGDALIGYVFACADTARYRRRWRRRVLVPVLARLVKGRYFLDVGTLRPLLGLGVAYLRGGGLRVPWREFPGHLHINTAAGYRGQAALSRALLHAAFELLAVEGVTRVHGVVMTSRARMVEKYERLGFDVVSRRRAPRPGVRGRGEAFWLVLTMDLSRLPPRPLDAVNLRSRAGVLAHGLRGR